MKRFAQALAITLVSATLPCAGQTLKGKVFGMDGGEKSALPGASIHWLGTTTGSTTNVNGVFQVDSTGIADRRLVASFIGYQSDTVSVGRAGYVSIVLSRDANTLKEVEVSGERPDTYIDHLSAIKTEVITSKELTKAACCDLAGCFDTQGSVQPTTTNIVTNAKELRILGLSGVYNQVLFDGMPLIQGLTYTYGISTIQGPLVENIFVAKGANSVLQGYESISGQINIEPKEPDRTDRFFFNAYMNSFGEKQANVNVAHKWKKWSALVAVHTTQPAGKVDQDEDTFLDLPLLTRYSLFTKWKYGNDRNRGLHTRIGVRYVNEERIGGQTTFDPDTDEGGTSHYGQTVRFDQPEAYTKTGFRFNEKHQLVFFGSAFRQQQRSYYGVVAYSAEQANAYGNLQYELRWNSKHDLKTGISYRYNELIEDLSDEQSTTTRTYMGRYRKFEEIPGVFAENTFHWRADRIILITGIRVDRHNVFGLFTTPRALLKYQFAPATTGRVSIGTGWRTANVFSENVNLLASSRDVVINGPLEPEHALNYGVNLTHNRYGTDVNAQFSLDLYRTQFSNQIFPDYDNDPTLAFVGNFTGSSVSNGLQVEAGFEFFKRAGTKIAYNYLEVYRVVNGTKGLLPFNPTHRLTGSFSFKPVHKKWHFDMNVHWYGAQRLPTTTTNPEDYQRPVTSQPYTVMNAQFTKTWKRIEVYGGCENILAFRQYRPIVGWQEPFSPYFDTSSVWGPTRGRELYIGVRWQIE